MQERGTSRAAWEWGRVLAVAGFVAATTACVWVKVQIGEVAQAVEAARARGEELREERSKLQAAVELARQPGIVRSRAEKELHMTDPPPTQAAVLVVEVGRD